MKRKICGVLAGIMLTSTMVTGCSSADLKLEAESENEDAADEAASKEEDKVKDSEEDDKTTEKSKSSEEKKEESKDSSDDSDDEKNTSSEPSDTEEIKIAYRYVEEEDDGNTYIYPMFYTCEDGYDKLQGALNDIYDSYKDRAEKFFEDSDRDDAYCDMHAYINREDSQVVSITVEYIQGAGDYDDDESYYYWDSDNYNIDVNTGDIIETADVFQNGDELYDAVVESIENVYTDSLPDNLYDWVEDAFTNDQVYMKMYNDHVRVYLENLVIYGDKEPNHGYAFADVYFSDEEAFKDNFATLQDTSNFVERYARSEDDITIELGPVDEKSGTYPFSLSIEDSEEYYKKVTVNYNDQSVSKDICCYLYTIDCVEYHGDYYVYIGVNSEACYGSLYVIKLDPDNLEISEAFQDGPFTSFAEIEERMVCANEFNLFGMRYSDRFGCSLAKREYHIGEDGMPEASSDYEYCFSIESCDENGIGVYKATAESATITSKVDIEAEVYENVDSDQCEKKTIESGSTFKYFRYDGDYIEFELEGGEIARFELIDEKLDGIYSTDDFEDVPCFDL